MDNMATGYTFGMSTEDFGNMDFQPSMAGEGQGGSHPPLMTALGPFSTSFTSGLGRDAVFSQSSMLSSRGAGLDLPRFHEGTYGDGTSAGFNPMISSRHHPFPPAGMQGFPEVFPQPMPNIQSSEGGFGSYSGVMSSTGTSSSGTNLVLSMPVFPNNPSSHGALIHPHGHESHSLDTGREDRRGAEQGSGLKTVQLGNLEIKLPSQSPGHGGPRSPLQSPPPSGPMQPCFPGQMTMPPTMHQQNPTGQLVPPAPTSPIGSNFKDDLRDFSGGPASDLLPPLVIGSEVTPIQRRRHSPRRAAMVAQEMAAAAAAALAIETKQAPMPPMLSPRDSHLLTALPHSVGYTHQTYNSGTAANQLVPDFNSHIPRRGRRPKSWSNNYTNVGVIQPGFNSQPAHDSGYPTNEKVAPFFKAGCLSLREPEVFDCGAGKVPLITQGTQTGNDSENQRLMPNIIDKAYTLKDPRFVNVNPKDGKGGFPLSSIIFSHGRPLFAPQQSPHKRLTPDGVYYTNFTEGDGYAKRGNSKTVVSPSFGDAAARAVMTTSVGDHSTIVTVAIMSRQNSGLGAGTKVTGTTQSPRPSTSHDSSSDDLKENILKSSHDGISASFSTPSGVRTRRGRKCNSVSGSSSLNTPTMSSRGRTLRRRADPDNISIEDDENFEELMEERKEKVKAAEQERMEISVRIDDSQCISYGDHKRWQCNQCDKSYTTKHNLVMHILDHQGIKPHLCLVCGRYFKQLSHLNTHMLTHDRVRPHVCQVCNKGFTQISHLKRHQTVHQESKPYSCEECGRGFTFPGELRVHKEKHASGRLLQDFSCDECGEEFASSMLLKQHEVIHENPNGHSCSFCNRTFRYPSQLRDHIVIHSNSRPYICTECGMDFMKEHHLRSHQFTHTGLRPYSCEICSRSFNQRANMLRHMLIHNSERSFKCDYCDKTFTQPQTLKAHMVVHADHKPFQCTLCGKEFGRLHNLHGHMHMHNNSKPYACFCGSSFTLKGNLNRHKKVKHGLNESTESMEEDAVHFLSSWSDRMNRWEGGDGDGEDDQADNETKIEDSISEEAEMNGHADGNGRLDSIDHDVDGSSTDMIDRNASGRKQRKSTPRKIPRQASGTKKRRKYGEAKRGPTEGEEDDEEDVDEGEEGGAEPDVTGTEVELPNLRLQALSDPSDPPLSTDASQKKQQNHPEKEDSKQPKAQNASTGRRRPGRPPAENSAKRGRRDRGRPQATVKKENTASEDQDDAKDGTDWPSSDKKKKSGKGAKLDSIIAQKFNTT